MEPHVEAMLKSLVAVAWADGMMDDAEHQVLEALIETFGLADADAAAIREFAAQSRTLEDVPLTELSADDRRLLLSHAVIVTHADGSQHEAERALLSQLADHLHIGRQEADAIVQQAEQRAERLKSLL
ncbi:MAG: TerB family tellurite resistance protein [Myxococcales bacterium]|nr:TerB family tellurite resistance protein [Myxococcales bacterium]